MRDRTEYTKRHNKTLMVMMVEIMKKFHMVDEKTVWYRVWTKPEEVKENERAKVWWNYEWKTPHQCEHRRPDMVVLEKTERRILIIDMACPLEKNVEAKEGEKTQKYQQLEQEISKMYPEHRAEVVPLVVGCLGGTNNLRRSVQKILGCDEKEARRTAIEMQRATMIGTGQVWRNFTNQSD